MKLLLSIIVLLLTALAAAAHPLGNFSVNQYSRLEVGKSEVRIRQVLDLAEIPTFQLAGQIDADRDGAFSADELQAYAARLTPTMLDNLSLAADGRPLALAVAGAPRPQLAAGAGNLPTLRIEWDLTARYSPTVDAARVRFENRNYAERLGWNELVVTRAGGVNVFDSTAFGSGVTDDLKAYPAETLDAPLKERAAEFSASLGALPAGARALANRDGHASRAIERDRLAELIAVPEITPAIALFGLLVAFGLGAVHALSPGHGKAVVGAYLVGSRGTPRHAAFLGLTVTITHTLGVFALGLVTILASSFILPETLLPFLSFVSGLLVLYIGLTMFKSRLFAALGREAGGHHHHGHAHDHAHGHHHHHGHAHDHHGHSPDHAHDDDGEPIATAPGSDGVFVHTHDGHTHSHLPPDEISWRSLAALGVSGGLLPCPSALVLMLSAISLGRVGYGLVLTTAFSFGLAATLTGVGLIFLYAGRAFGGTRLAQSRLARTLPVASAFVIACLGALICYQSF